MILDGGGDVLFEVGVGDGDLKHTVREVDREIHSTAITNFVFSSWYRRSWFETRRIQGVYKEFDVDSHTT